MALPSLWVYKNNAKAGHVNASYGDWDDFFRKRGAQEWGGSWMTTQPRSLLILREEMQPGDRVLAWQTDRRVAVGTATVEKIKSRSDGESDLILRAEAAFDHPVPILELKLTDSALAEVGAFKPGGGTLFRTTPKEARLLLGCCRKWNVSR